MEKEHRFQASQHSRTEMFSFPVSFFFFNWKRGEQEEDASDSFAPFARKFLQLEK